MWWISYGSITYKYTHNRIKLYCFFSFCLTCCLSFFLSVLLGLFFSSLLLSNQNGVLPFYIHLASNDSIHPNHIIKYNGLRRFVFLPRVQTCDGDISSPLLLLAQKTRALIPNCVLFSWLPSVTAAVGRNSAMHALCVCSAAPHFAEEHPFYSRHMLSAGWDYQKYKSRWIWFDPLHTFGLLQSLKGSFDGDAAH